MVWRNSSFFKERTLERESPDWDRGGWLCKCGWSLVPFRLGLGAPPFTPPLVVWPVLPKL